MAPREEGFCLSVAFDPASAPTAGTSPPPDRATPGRASTEAGPCGMFSRPSRWPLVYPAGLGEVGPIGEWQPQIGRGISQREPEAERASTLQ